MKRLATYLVCLVICFKLMGGHWVVMQGVAWATMLHEYAELYGWEESVQMTFGGNKPCEMCMAIEKGRSQEEDQKAPSDQLLKSEKLVGEAGEYRDLMPPAPVDQEVDWATFAPKLTGISTRPPSPPPQGSTLS